MVRRRVAAGVAVVLLIVIVLVVNGCLKSEKLSSLKDYAHSVNTLAQESQTQVAAPLFTELADAGSKSALDVEVQIGQLLIGAQTIANHAAALSVPGEMTEAQRALVLAMDLRVEAMSKISALISPLLGGQNKEAAAKIAGDMEIFLASDVLYSQRVVPFIQQTLAANGVHELASTPSRFLPNVGWLETSTLTSRISGQTTAGTTGPVTGNHGSALIAVAVATNTLAPEPTINHIGGGGSPTFTVTVENSGEFPQTNVKVDVTVTAAGKQYKATHVINQTTPGNKVNVEIPVTGIPLGLASKVEVFVEGVPGENDLENNKGTFLAIFSS